MENVDERPRIAPDRALRGPLQSGRQYLPQSRIARGVSNRGRQDLPHRDRQLLGILHQLAEPRHYFDLAPEEQYP